ncbi:peptidoglycan editing factor PgeF [Thermocrinis sp.]|uniref:peptidoglycan editing factor PgeF n=1 Tax=Thermocrinis sp. TaxID=2024383 RepID=UPI002FDE51A3
MHTKEHTALKRAWITIRYKNSLAGLKLYQPEDKVFTLKQIHSDRVVYLEKEWHSEGDAIITTRKNFPIGVRTADCVPMAFLGKEAVGVVHAGWRGIKANIVEKFLEKFLKIEEAPLVFVGPSAKACCYEVGKEFEESFIFLHHKNGKLFLDTQLEVLHRLKNFGVKRIITYNQCTICTEKFPSYRRDKTSQRMLLFALLEA